MQLEPDMIVRNVVNNGFYRVRSVSRTKAVCWPCNRNGKRFVYMGGTAIEFKQENLRIVRIQPKQQ